jgi:hypothetical protein
MPTSPDPRPRRSFPREGFTVYFDPDGLEIRVDDYHPMPLKLSWTLIERLQHEARTAGREGAGGSGVHGA